MISGVIASALFLLLVHFARNRVIPIVKTALYDGPELSKNWDTYDKLNGDCVGKCELYQSGENVTISSRRHIGRSNQRTTRKYTYKGTITANQIVCTFYDEGARNYVRGALVAKISGDSRLLIGKITYMNNEKRGTGAIVSHNIYFRAR